MKIFHYHSVTGEFAPNPKTVDGSDVADKSPLEPGKFLMPAFTTDVTPIAPKDGFVRCFINGQWKYVEDHRGTVVYTVKDPSGVTTVIDYIGPLNPSHTLTEPIEVTEKAIINKARTDLQVSDITLLRCLENKVDVPVEWVDYRNGLRDIISGKAKVSTVPAKPIYPAGT